MIQELPPAVRRNYAEALAPEDYLHAVWRAKWWCLLLSITGLAAAAAWVQFFPSEYTSRAVIRFIPPKISDRYVTSADGSWAEQRSAAMSQTLSSTLTARKMVEGANLYPELRRFFTAADLVPRFQKALNVKAVTWKGGAGTRPIASIEISFTYPNPAVAKQVVQQLVESVYETNDRYRGDQSMGTAQFLTEQTEAVRGRLEELEDELGQLGRPDRIAGDHEWALKIQHLYSVENRLGHVQTSLRNLRRDLADRIEEIAAAEAEYKRVPASITAQSENLTLEAVQLKNAYNQAAVNVEFLTKRYKSNHPDLVAAVALAKELQQKYDEQHANDVEAARARARRKIQERIDGLRADRDALSATIRNQEGEEAQLTRKATELRANIYSNKQSDFDYLRLMREYTSAGDHYRTLFRKEQESQLAAEVDRLGHGEMVELLDPPTVPTRPEFPSSPVKLVLGAILGLGLGLLIAIARFQVRPTVRTGRHLVFWQGAVLLGDLPAGRIGGATPAEASFFRRIAPRLTGISSLLLAAIVISTVILTGCRTNRLAERDSWLHAAKNAERDHRFDQAIRCFQMAAKIDARSAEAHSGLARTLLATGEIETALGHLIRAAELRPDDQKIQTDLASVFYRIYHSDTGRSTSTLRELEEQANRLIARWPAVPEGYRAMALVLCERGRPAEAASLLRRGMLKTGPHLQMTVELASVLYRVGEKEEAESLLRQLIEADSKCAQAYDLLYLQLRDRRQTDAAGEVLLSKWSRVGDADSGLQYAAHLESTGRRNEMIAQAEAVERKLGHAPDALSLVGGFWVSRGEYVRAARVYESAVARFPLRRGEFTGKLSEIAAAQGHTDQALATLDSALKRSPSDLSLQAYRAALDLDSAQPAQVRAARLQLELLLQRMPTSAFVRFHLGRSYMRAGDLLKAGEQFERCIRLDPNYAPGWLALAESEYRMGNVARSRTTLDRLLARAPMYSQALLLKARVHGDLNQPREMKSALDLAVIAGAPAREVAVERARLLISAGDTEAAIRLLRATAVSSGHEPSVSIALASAEAALGRRDLALAALDASAASHPAATEIAFAKGTFLLQFGEHQQALSIFSDLAAQTPASPALAARKADSLALSGRLREAAAEYERAMRLPGAAPHVWVSAGAVYSAIGDADSARRCYQQALARDGSNPIALNNLAYLLGRSGQQLDYALQLAQNAGAVLPDSDEVQDTLIYLSLRMGLKQQALGILERAASRSTSSSKAWFKSLRAQLSKGTAEEVLRRMEEAQRTRKLT